MRWRLILLTLLIVGNAKTMAFEKPSFETVRVTDGFELRQYAPYLIAETEVTAEFGDAGNQAFRALFNYISGNNTSQHNTANDGEKISMTVPVTQIKTGEDTYRVSFLLPAKYSSKSAPLPNSNVVAIKEVEATLMATIRYSGNWSQERYEKKLVELRTALQADGQYRAAGDPIFARYNPPIMPSLFRHNEILIPVVEKP